MVKPFLYFFSLAAAMFFTACNCPLCKDSQTSTPKKESKVSNVQAEPISITSTDQFDKEVIKSSNPVVVLFSAEWCNPCKQSKPIFNEVAKELGSKYKFAIIDVNKVQKIAENFGIQGVPTIIFFKDSKEVNRKAGALSNKEAFTSTVKNIFEKNKN